MALALSLGARARALAPVVLGAVSLGFRHGRWSPFPIILVCYAAALCMPGTSVAQNESCTGPGAAICRGPISGPPNYFQVCDGGIPCGIANSESSAIAAYEAVGSRHEGIRPAVHRTLTKLRGGNHRARETAAQATTPVTPTRLPAT
jgi:hypothetical protein